MAHLFNTVILNAPVINCLHILVYLEYLEETMPVSIVRAIHCSTLAGTPSSVMPQVVHEFLNHQTRHLS